MAVLNYLEGLPQKANKRVLSGQFTGHPFAMSDGQYSMDHYFEIEELHALTGHWLALLGVDYISVLPRSWDTQDNITPHLIEHWKKGGLVIVTLHFNNPLTQGNHTTWPRPDLDRVITAGTGENVFFNSELDRVAAKMQQFEDQGAVVLFRPFHEMNVGFWWGGAGVEEKYKKLWKYTFNYMHNVKSLDNLLWVYSPSAVDWGVIDYYPGDQYVDIVAMDSYTYDTLNSGWAQSAYDVFTGSNQYNTKNKPIGFGENGAGMVSYEIPTGYDYTELIKAIKARYQKTIFFQYWSGNYGLQHGGEGTRDLLNDPWIINREDVCIPGVAYHTQSCASQPAAPSGLAVR